MTFWHDRPEGEFASIQVLRALAALVVIMVHVPVEIAYGLKWADTVPIPLTAGAAADLFFVISGFVIVALLLVFAVIVGIVVHLVFERPLTRMLYRWIGDTRASVPLRAAE